MEVKFNCIVTGNNKKKIAEFTEWLDGDGWKHDYYAPLVTNGVFDHRELGDGWFGEIIRRPFTGLLDKKGEEIYFGDILCNDKYNTWEWRGVVKFSHGVFGAEWLSNIKRQSMVGSWGQKHNLRKLDDDILERQVIVGNIFENPELLHNK